MTKGKSRLVIQHARLVNILAWLKTAGFLCSAGTAGYGVVTGDWIWAAVGVLSAAGTLTFGLLSLAAGIAVVLSQAWPAGAGPFTAAVAFGLLKLVAYWSRPGPLDEAALAEAVRQLPDGLRTELRVAADAGRVDSMTLVRVATGADPYLWREHKPDASAPVGSEGDVIGGTGWTVVAAEAALVVGCRSGSASPPDAQHLAAAAMLVPHSAARAALGSAQDALLAAERVLGLSGDEAIDQLIAASKRPGGELLALRVLLPESSESLLPEDRWQAIRPGADSPPDRNTHA